VGYQAHLCILQALPPWQSRIGRKSHGFWNRGTFGTYYLGNVESFFIFFFMSFVRRAVGEIIVVHLFGVHRVPKEMNGLEFGVSHVRRGSKNYCRRTWT
jgi:hypothetical protein